MPTRVLAYRKGATGITGHHVGELSALLADPDVVTTWIDLDDRTESEEKLLADHFQLHPLVLDDVFHDSPHPKVEDFGDYLVMVVHGVEWAKHATELETIELDILIGPRWVVTHHHGDALAAEAVAKDLERSPRAMQKGPSFLAHAILDHITDHFSPLMDAFDETIDGLETRVMSDPKPELLTKIFSLKRSLQQIRRVSVHQRDMLLRISRGEFDLVDKAALPFFRDVYDHFVRVADLTDSYRDLVAGILEMYLSVQSQKLNEVMKILTIISTIVLPLNFIAGVYGMNFDVLPGIHWRYGVFATVAVMIALSVALIFFFKRRGWM